VCEGYRGEEIGDLQEIFCEGKRRGDGGSKEIRVKRQGKLPEIWFGRPR